MNYLALAGAIIMIVAGGFVFMLWSKGSFPFESGCFARLTLFLISFLAGFLMVWAFAPHDITMIVCGGPLVGLGVGTYSGLFLPTIAPRIPTE